MWVMVPYACVCVCVCIHAKWLVLCVRLRLRLHGTKAFKASHHFVCECGWRCVWVMMYVFVADLNVSVCGD